MWWAAGPRTAGSEGTRVHFRELCLAAASPKTSGVLERRRRQRDCSQAGFFNLAGTRHKRDPHRDSPAAAGSTRTTGARAERTRGERLEAPRGLDRRTGPASPSALPWSPVSLPAPVHTALPVPSVPGAPYQILRLHKPSHSGGQANYLSPFFPFFSAKDHKRS